MIEDNSRISDRINTEPANMENSTPPDGADSQNSSEEDFDMRKEVISWLLSLAFVIVAVLFINNFIIVNAQVPSSSMENTIMPGNRLIGTRFSYWFSEPERGDIVIFHYPLDEKIIYIKRVIGLPGDRPSFHQFAYVVIQQIMVKDARLVIVQVGAFLKGQIRVIEIICVLIDEHALHAHVAHELIGQSGLARTAGAANPDKQHCVDPLSFFLKIPHFSPGVKRDGTFSRENSFNLSGFAGGRMGFC